MTPEEILSKYINKEAMDENVEEAWPIIIIAMKEYALHIAEKAVEEERERVVRFSDPDWLRDDVCDNIMARIKQQTNHIIEVNKKEAITEEWLITLGFRKDGMSGLVKDDWLIWNSPTGWQVRYKLANTNCYRHFETKEDLLELWRVMGVQIKQQTGGK